MAKTQKQDVFQELKHQILTLVLQPGSDLDEVSLSDRFGLSRTPLREILQRLAGDGYVQITSNKGAKVASLDFTTLRTFFQTAPMIYASISRLAAETQDQAGLEALKAAQLSFEKAVKARDPSAAALANHQFHRCIGALTQNPYLIACLERLLIDHTRLGRTFYQPSSQEDVTLIETASTQHDALIAAIDEQDPERAVELTLLHWDLSRDQIERFVRPDPLPFNAKDMADAL